jgi:LuxR family maltose regulon positive regulatory protein
MERATRLVDQIAADLIVRREPNNLLKLMDQLPPDRCQDYPVLCIWHAWALLFLGQLEAVEPILQNVEANQSKASSVPIHGYVATVRAYLANQLGDLQNAINLSEQALREMREIPFDPITLIYQGAAVIWLGVNHRLLGDLGRASQFFVEAASLNYDAGNIYGAMAAIEQSAELAIIRGQLHKANDFYLQALQMSRRWVETDGRGRGTSVAEAGPHLGLGAVLYQWNDLEGATPQLLRAVELFELGEAWERLFAYKMLAYLKQAEGNYKASSDLLSKAKTIRENVSVTQPNITDQPSLEQLGIMLGRHHKDVAYQLNDAVRRIEKMGIQPEDKIDFTSTMGYGLESVYTDLSRVLIELGRAGEALPLLERLLEAARSMGRYGDEIRYLTIRAVAYHSQGKNKSAMKSLGRALNLAKTEGYVRLFVDEGEPMALMLTAAISQNMEREYATELLAAFPEHVKQAAGFDRERSAIPQPLIEPLSNRELEVLCLMADGHKYDEVANLLVISVNTVRHHTRNIYGKLDVHNRAQAIARAQDLGLI